MARGLVIAQRAWLLPALLLCSLGCARYSLDQWPALALTLDHPDYERYRAYDRKTMRSTGFRFFSIPIVEPKSPSTLLAKTGAEAYANVEVTHSEFAIPLYFQFTTTSTSSSGDVTVYRQLSVVGFFSHFLCFPHVRVVADLLETDKAAP